MIKTCKICKQNSLKDNVIDLKVTKLYSCNGCTGVFAYPNYTKKAGNYHQATDDKQWEEYYKPFRTSEFENVVLKYKRQFSNAQAFLDIGCGLGWFLDVVKRNYPKIDTVGIEPSKSKKSSLEKRHNLYKLPANRLSEVKGMFDIVSYWHVFEHIGNPHEILKLTREKMKRDGLLIIAVPNNRGIMYRFSYLLAKMSLGKFTYPLEKLWWIDNPNGHLFDYNLRSLKTVLEMSKFEIIDWETKNAIDIANTRKRIRSSGGGVSLLISYFGSLFFIIITKLGELLNMRDVLMVAAVYK